MGDLIPNKKSLEAVDMDSLIWVLYGNPGVGKTTFAASHPGGTLFLHTDPGLKFIEAYKRPVATWLEFKKCVQEIYLDRPEGFRCIAVDTVDLLYLLCRKYVCQKRGIEHPSDEAYGKGYDLVREEFANEVVKLSSLGYGMMFVSQTRDIEIKGKAMRTSQVVPGMPKQARELIEPLADVIAYLGFRDESADNKEDTDRVMFFEPTETLNAKDRTGKLPKSLVIPREGGFDEVTACFHGKHRKDAEEKPRKKIVLLKKGGK